MKKKKAHVRFSIGGETKGQLKLPPAWLLHQWFPLPWIPCDLAHYCSESHTSMGWPIHYWMLFRVVTQSKTRLLNHWNSSISMLMLASLIYSQKPTVDHESSHKRQNPPSFQKTNTLKLMITISSFRGIHSFLCSVRHRGIVHQEDT